LFHDIFSLKVSVKKNIVIFFANDAHAPENSLYFLPVAPASVSVWEDDKLLGLRAG
jgi:hypothetical protein